jgi:RimJ/RimL family protein N-acetyltransferase
MRCTRASGAPWRAQVAREPGLVLGCATVRLRFDPLQPCDADALHAFLSSSDWPHHLESRVDEGWVRERLTAGYFVGDTARSFWIRGDDAEQPLGFSRVFELGDPTPLFDLRLHPEARGRGLGTLALAGLTQWAFAELPELERFGGYTRHDNTAMRRVFEKCGFTQEAYHRRAWRVAGGQALDAVGYAILREEAARL